MGGDDAELLERWRGGDRAAGNQLFQRCFAPLYRFFANKTRSAADTEELVQKTFLRLLSVQEKFKGKSSFLTFVLAVANYVLKHYYRDQSRLDEQFDPLTSSAVGLGMGAHTQLECAEVQQLLLAALREIPVELQVVIELYYVESLSPETIADVLEVNANTVRGRIVRAREHLRDKVVEVAARGRISIEPPSEDQWDQLVKTAFPTTILSAAFHED